MPTNTITPSPPRPAPHSDAVLSRTTRSRVLAAPACDWTAGGSRGTEEEEEEVKRSAKWVVSWMTLASATLTVVQLVATLVEALNTRPSIAADAHTHTRARV